MRNNRVSYRSYTTNVRAIYSEDVVYKSLKDIDDVLQNLNTIINTCGYATLVDYYNLTGGTVTEHDDKYGWTNLLNCNISGSRYGYVLRMPNATYLNENPVENAYAILENVGEEDAYDAVIEARAVLSKAL